MTDSQKPIALLYDALHGNEHYISRYVTCIGRAPSADLPLNDHSISRAHAVLFCMNDTFLLEDLDSLNGTTLNGVPVRGRVKLKPGDEIRVGLTVLKFSLIGNSAVVADKHDDASTIPPGQSFMRDLPLPAHRRSEFANL